MLANELGMAWQDRPAEDSMQPEDVPDSSQAPEPSSRCLTLPRLLASPGDRHMLPSRSCTGCLLLLC